MVRLRGLALFPLLWCAVSLFQWRTGAFQSEFGSDPDEPAHYITGLMVRDYVAGGLPESPLGYARNYYLHYPKVALGHWPPFFYIVQAAWTLVFTPSRAAVMLLMGAITALLATVLCETIRREISLSFGLGAAVLFVSLPVVERFSSAVMAEVLLALLVFLAVLSYGRYLDEERWQAAACFGVLSALAILTKGSAMPLALVPPFALLIARRWDLLRRFSFWLPAILVVAVAGPWYLWIPGAQHESVARFGGIELRLERLSGTVITWAGMLGAVPAIAAALGLSICVVRSRRGSAGGKWIAGLAVLLATYLTRLLIGAFEDRHLMADLPVLLMFAASSVSWLWSRLPWRSIAAQSRLRWLAAAALVVLIAFNVKASPAKRHYGYSEVARNLLADPEFKDSVILVCSNATGEGMLISEIAMHESRPGHIVLRATKMLASIDWMGWDYRLLFYDSEDVFHYLEGIPVGVVVIDGEGRETPHGGLLYRAIQSHPESWKMVAWQPDKSGAGRGSIQMYRLVGQEHRRAGKIQIPMRSNLYGNF